LQHYKSISRVVSLVSNLTAFTPFAYQSDGLSPSFMSSPLTFVMPELFLQGITNNVRLKFSVGDTTPGFPIGIEQDN
jgi:hypothetical protein